MAREEELRFAWEKERKKRIGTGDTVHLESFLLGAHYADEHPKNPWRNAKKELPKVGQEVIGILDTGEIFDMRMTDEGIWFTDILAIDCPQYWMPIPELPKRE